MSRIEIYRLKDGGEQEVYATYKLVGEEVVGEGNERLLERLERDGILDRNVEPAEKVFPKDGERFLEVLLSHFDSGYLIASQMSEDKAT